MKRMRVWIGKGKENEEDKVKENINKEDESKRCIGSRVNKRGANWLMKRLKRWMEKVNKDD